MLFFHPKNTEQTEFPLPALHNKAVYIKQDNKHKKDTYKKANPDQHVHDIPALHTAVDNHDRHGIKDIKEPCHQAAGK